MNNLDFTTNGIFDNGSIVSINNFAFLSRKTLALTPPTTILMLVISKSYYKEIYLLWTGGAGVGSRVTAHNRSIPKGIIIFINFNQLSYDVFYIQYKYLLYLLNIEYSKSWIELY